MPDRQRVQRHSLSHHGATYQPRAGIAKHDYVAWGGFARRADQAGVDVIQNCEVTGFVTDGDRVTGGVRTTQGDIGAGQVALCAAGHTSTLTDMLGIRTPLQSHPLQALVSELLEPVHPTIVMSNAVHVYVSQAHKGELVMGAGVDSYNGYGQRGAFHIIERQMAAAVELFPPVFARAHLLRTWAGIVDTSPDASPIVGRTPYENLYVNAGWGTGGFKRRRASGGVWPTPSPTTNHTSSSLRSASTGSSAVRWSTNTAPPPSRTDHPQEQNMQLIECPWCGTREETEFHYGGGEATSPTPTTRRR